LCEKPLALSVEEVDAVQSAAHRHGRVVAEAFMYRHHAQTGKVQELLASGALGNLRLIRGGFAFLLNDAGDIRLNSALGGGSIWDVGCYPISYARTLAGKEPREVFGWQATGSSGVDLTFVGQMRFDEDVFAQFASSFALPFHTFVEVVGTEGSLSIPHPFKPESDAEIYLTRAGKPERIKVKGQELYLGEVEDMADAVLLGHAPRISLEDSRGNVAAITALLESARTGKPVRLP
jgi:predicted dehydrogenase